MKMSKMKMPEMSVVRFDESDVICASIVTRMELFRYGDGNTSPNGYVKINGVNYGVNQRNSLDQAYARFDNFDTSTHFHWGSSENTFYSILEGDNTTLVDEGRDGVYTYENRGDASGWGFYHQ